MVKCLITSGADINAVDNVSSMLCCYHYNHYNHNVLYTIQDNETALHYASREGHCSIVKYLISSGADINAVSYVSCIFCFYPHNVYYLEIFVR